MKIVAFLQNPYFYPEIEDSVIKRYNKDLDFRRRILRRSMTGRRLAMAFGNDWFGMIHWDNACTEASRQPSDPVKPNFTHVERVVNTERPDAILTFGNLARDVVVILKKDALIDVSIPHLVCRHPNARGITAKELREFANEVKEQFGD